MDTVYITWYATAMHSSWWWHTICNDRTGGKGRH